MPTQASPEELATLRDWWRGQYPHDSTQGGPAEQEAKFQEFLGEYWLNLRGHKLTHLPEAFGVLSKMRRLDLIGNRLDALPDWLCELPALTHLDARGNPLQSVSSGLGQCPNLRFLGVDTGVPSPDLARWHRMRQEPLGEIQVTFSKTLGELGHELPTDAARFRQNGSVGPEEGDYGYFDTVHYRFGRDERGEFLDWHTEHRIWGDRCGRIREDGSEESSEPCFYCEG